MNQNENTLFTKLNKKSDALPHVAVGRWGELHLATTRLISAPTILESEIVIQTRKGPLGRAELELFIYEAELTIIPFDKAQVQFALLAWEKYGKGRHPAALNFGDCFSYALAKATDEPLLFKGLDFVQTDIKSC